MATQTAVRCTRDEGTTVGRYQAGIETEARIIDATRSLLADGGLEAATLKAICDRAEVRAGSFYNLFASKDAAILTVVILLLIWERIANGDGPLVMMRADMDGLPVAEKTGLPFASTVTTEWRGVETGVMHACGHDAHMAILMGVAEVLKSLLILQQKKPLSFREKKMLDKARHMLIMEISISRSAREEEAIGLLQEALQSADLELPLAL